MTEFEQLLVTLRRWPERANYLLSPADRTVLLRGVLDLQLTGVKIDPLSDPDSYKGARNPNDLDNDRFDH